MGVVLGLVWIVFECPAKRSSRFCLGLAPGDPRWRLGRLRQGLPGLGPRPLAGLRRQRPRVPLRPARRSAVTEQEQRMEAEQPDEDRRSGTEWSGDNPHRGCGAVINLWRPRRKKNPRSGPKIFWSADALIRAKLDESNARTRALPRMLAARFGGWSSATP